MVLPVVLPVSSSYGQPLGMISGVSTSAIEPNSICPFIRRGNNGRAGERNHQSLASEFAQNERTSLSIAQDRRARRGCWKAVRACREESGSEQFSLS
jgi:hypothetical protein